MARILIVDDDSEAREPITDFLWLREYLRHAKIHDEGRETRP